MATLFLVDITYTDCDLAMHFFQFMIANRIPLVLVFTKLDKCEPGQAQANYLNFMRHVETSYGIRPKALVTSAHTKLGGTELLRYLY